MKSQPLKGKTALVTSGPTHEPIDPVRFLGNRSSGKQGHAIAEALRDAGARVVLISGPVALQDPKGVTTQHVTTALEMLAAVKAALPVDIAICAAAVADWRPARVATQKLKKAAGEPPVLRLKKNPDIVKTGFRGAQNRHTLKIGFAAETENLEANARAKLLAKGCDCIVANDVSGGKGFDAERNTVCLVTREGVEHWPSLDKHAIAARLVARVAQYIKEKESC